MTTNTLSPKMSSFTNEDYPLTIVNCYPSNVFRLSQNDSTVSISYQCEIPCVIQPIESILNIIKM